MKRTDATRNVGNLFDPGNPGAGLKGTVVDYTWLNSVQEELVNLLMGLNPAAVLDQTNADLHQIWDALSAALGTKVSVTGGTMTANPTVALGVATKQYVDGTVTLAAAGDVLFPNGLRVKWGSDSYFLLNTNTSMSVPIVFPLAFPNATFKVFCTKVVDAAGNAAQISADVLYGSTTTAGFTITYDNLATVNKSIQGVWFAIGN